MQCVCNDQIVPTIDCVNGRFCKADIECGPKGECPMEGLFGIK